MTRLIKSNYVLLIGFLFSLMCPLEVGSKNKTDFAQFMQLEKVLLTVYELNVSLLEEDESGIPPQLVELVRLNRKNINALLEGNVELLIQEGMLSKSYLDKIGNGEIESVRSELMSFSDIRYGNGNQVLLTHIFLEPKRKLAFIREQVSGFDNGEYVTVNDITRFKLETDKWVYVPNLSGYYTRLIESFISRKFPYEKDVYGRR